MALSSSSTLAQIEAQYDNSADWFISASIATAKDHAEAITMLLRRLVSSATKGSNSYSQRVDLLRDELREVRSWLLARDPDLRDVGTTDASVTVADFRKFRG